MKPIMEVIQMREQVEDLKAENGRLRAALEQIAGIGGNLSDDCYTDATGPRDAAHRGLMYVHARAIARKALEAK